MLINIDAGHGSNTAGKRTPPMPKALDIDKDGKADIKKGEQYREHYANVGVCSFLVMELERCGFKTMRTGWDDDNAKDDVDMPLTDRQKAVSKVNCDYSISIHFNAFGDGNSFNSANGVGIYIHNKYIEQSEKLAIRVLNRLIEGTKQNNRGITKKALAMCNCNDLDVKAAILIELAFMTNEHEAVNMMANEAYWKECAIEICKGVCDFTGRKYVAESYIPSKAITPESPKEDIKWAQERLNKVLPDYFPKLKVDGSYGAKTRLAVLVLWDKLGWGKHMNDDGRKIGTSTREYLANA